MPSLTQEQKDSYLDYVQNCLEDPNLEGLVMLSAVKNKNGEYVTNHAIFASTMILGFFISKLQFMFNKLYED